MEEQAETINTKNQEKPEKTKPKRVMTPEMLEKLAVARQKSNEIRAKIKAEGEKGKLEHLQSKMDKIKLNKPKGKEEKCCPKKEKIEHEEEEEEEEIIVKKKQPAKIKLQKKKKQIIVVEESDSDSDNDDKQIIYIPRRKKKEPPPIERQQAQHPQQPPDKPPYVNPFLLNRRYGFPLQ